MLNLEIGQVVFSKQGKDNGDVYVVSGFAPDGRIFLIRPDKFNVSNPKIKNIKHVQPVNIFVSDIANLIKAGVNNIDRGYFFERVSLCLSGA